jgi:hypothetical protein
MITAVPAINLMKSSGLSRHQLQQSLADTGSEYGDVKYFSDIHWLSKADMVSSACNLLNEITFYLERKDCC